MAADHITTANWGFPPYNRQGFQKVQALFPTMRISRGRGPATTFEVATREVGGIVYTSQDGSQRSVRQMLDETFTDSFLVVKHGVILHEEYFNAMTPESHHLLNSVSKSLIGNLVGIVVEQGLLGVDDTVVSHLPSFRQTAFDETTVRTALDMTAAVQFDEDYANPGADFWRENAVVGWRPQLVRKGDPETLEDYARSLTRKDQAEGEKYHYRTVLTNLLGMLLEKVTDRSLDRLLSEELWGKLGPEQDASIVVDRLGRPYVGAGMNTCTRDLARFGEMIVQQGYYNGEQIVPASWIADTLQGNAQLKSIFAASNYGAAMPGAHYRNQTWVFDSVRGIAVAIGIHGQAIYMNMTTGVVIVKFSSQPESVNQQLFMDTFAAMNRITEEV